MNRKRVKSSTFRNHS